MRGLKFILILSVLAIYVLTPMMGQRKKIEIWCTDKEVAGLEPVKKQFYRDKKVDVEINVQAEVRSTFKSASVGKGGPDIVVGAHDWVGELAKNGVISEINLSDKDKSKYFKVGVDGFTYNGKLYGVPYCVESMVMFYNKKLIDKVPATWEEVLAKAKTMTKDGKYGFLYGLDNNFYNNFPFIGSQGGYIFKWVNGRFDISDVGLGSPGAIEGAKFINEFVRQGVIPSSTNNGVVIQNFKEGKVAMIMDGPWNTSDYVNSMGADVVGMSKLPTLKGRATVPFVGARGFLINTYSKSKDNAIEFVIKYAGEVDGQYAMYKAGGRPPAHIAACNKAMAEDKYTKTVIDSVKDGIPMPNVKAMAVVFNYAAGMVDKFKTGETTVENAVKNAVQSIKTDLSKNTSKYD